MEASPPKTIADLVDKATEFTNMHPEFLHDVVDIVTIAQGEILSIDSNEDYTVSKAIQEIDNLIQDTTEGNKSHRYGKVQQQ